MSAAEKIPGDYSLKKRIITTFSTYLGMAGTNSLIAGKIITSSFELPKFATSGAVGFTLLANFFLAPALAFGTLLYGQSRLHQREKDIMAKAADEFLASGGLVKSQRLAGQLKTFRTVNSIETPSELELALEQGKAPRSLLVGFMHSCLSSYHGGPYYGEDKIARDNIRQHLGMKPIHTNARVVPVIVGVTAAAMALTTAFSYALCAVGFDKKKDPEKPQPAKPAIEAPAKHDATYKYNAGIKHRNNWVETRATQPTAEPKAVRLR